jgi:hypothetical protein
MTERAEKEPTRGPSRQMDVVVSVRMTGEQLNVIQRNADREGMFVSTYLRERALRLPLNGDVTVREVRDLLCVCPNKAGRHACDHNAERVVALFGKGPELAAGPTDAKAGSTS